MNASPFGAQVVRRTPEVKRIAALPRRVWTEDAAQKLADILTQEFRRPCGTMALRPVQAIALYEAMEVGGLFGPIRVGGGKTLCTLLLPLALDAKRPVLFLPAALIEKTWHERKALAEHWRLATNLQLVSYESLGLVTSSEKLEYIRPDLIIADECHYWKNKRAGRTRRVIRYMREHPETRFVALSGTVVKGSLQDFAHMLRWALKSGAPVPLNDEELLDWSNSLDERVNPLARAKPEALFDIGPRDPALATIPAARRVFQSRLLETRGVVASSAKDGVDCSLRISALEYEPAPVTVTHIANMKGTWTTPDGWTFSEALELRRYIRELALGFHSIWDPRPPVEWVSARREWASFVREVLSSSRTLDTELQVANAVDVGSLTKFREAGTELLAAWRGIRDTFKIQPKPVWHDDTALRVCAEWAKREKGLIWCEHRHFAYELAKLTGLMYYGAGGLTDSGASIVHVKPGQAVILSRQANTTGRNLQAFSRNLITSIEPSADINEQLLGRTHRDGQEADEVHVDVLHGCREHHDAFYRAVDGAKAARDMLGHSQKLLLADIVFPNITQRVGPLWV